jgi:hypothetical protein
MRLLPHSTPTAFPPANSGRDRHTRRRLRASAPLGTMHPFRGATSATMPTLAELFCFGREPTDLSRIKTAVVDRQPLQTHQRRRRRWCGDTVHLALSL